MDLPDRLVIGLGKAISLISRSAQLGAGATWPGEIALRLQPTILSYLLKKLHKGVVIVAGTNGKTTTSLMVKNILEQQGFSVIHNGSGANLLNGVVSAFIQEATWAGDVAADWGIFEVDENTLPLVAAELGTKNPELRIVIVLLNLFRDQLDRYGEVDIIAEKWEKALESLESQEAREGSAVTLILNADDPLIAHLGLHTTAPVRFFGVSDTSKYLPNMEHATDSIFCLNCGGRLTYEGVYFSHIGVWSCTKCNQARPTPDISTWQSPLPGLYNLYNTLAAVSVAGEIGIAQRDITRALASFLPAFGRQEEFAVDGRKVKLFLSKNPAGFNASLRTILELGAHYVLIVLNDRIPDGRDVSWIWDVDFEMIADRRGWKKSGFTQIVVAGNRCYDLALRIKYALLPLVASRIYADLKEAIRDSLKLVKPDDTLYILPTYSAMLEVRKILTGRKIL